MRGDYAAASAVSAAGRSARAGSGGSGVPGASLMMRKRHAVGDAQGALEARQQLARRVELQEVVLRLGLVADLVGHGAHAPVLLVDDLAARGDHRAHVRQDLLAAVVLGLRVEEEHEVVGRGGLGHERGRG